jgi:head-tail adaptor
MRNADEIGKMTRKVSFETVTRGKTSIGAPQDVYAHSFYQWCSRRQTATTEQYINSRLVAPYSYVYKTHYRSVINETLRLVDGSEKFEILSVDPDPDKVFIEIAVQKIVE